MKKYRLKSDINTRKKIAILLAAILFCALLTMYLLERSGITNILESADEEYINVEIQEDRTTSTTPTAQAEYSEGDEKTPGNSLSETRGNSVIIDNQGELPSGTDTSKPVTSESGEISVFTPMANSSIESGQIIAGKSSLPRITYRLIDDVSGMIATGELNVVNSNFSGIINFDTPSKNGRIDIFATKTDGSEYSYIEIPINFRWE